ncbi:MAG TPA: prolipoprotein diacylglyceryl transferase family protein [Polyangiaceae bacterium]
MAPLVPYFEPSDFVLVPERVLGGFPAAAITLKPFGTLVALGVYAGSACAVRHARRLGMNERVMISLLTWIVISSFVFGHVFDALSYYPDEVRRDPLMLLRLWEGLSSFGGFAGAVIGGLAWRVRHRTPIFAYADVVASCFPVSWSFGRLGCSVVHDHPGLRSDAWYAVRYPGGGRLDLGLYELLITLPLMVVFLVLQRKPRPWGFYLAIMCSYYAPLRFLLDFLRVRPGEGAGPFAAAGDVRYLGLTPAQWGCLPLLALGVGAFLQLRRSGTALPPVPAAFARSGPDPEGAGSDSRDER